MVDCKGLFEAARSRILQTTSASFFKKNFTFPSLYDDQSPKSSGNHQKSSKDNESLLRRGSKAKANVGSYDLSSGKHNNEVSLRGRTLSGREANEFRSLLCGKIPIVSVKWSEVDTDPELQARFYNALGNGLIRITDIPKIPSSYESSDILFLGLDSEDDSYGNPHFYQIATRDYVYISSSFRALARYIIQEYGLSKSNHILWGTNIEYEFGNIAKDWDQDMRSIKIKWRRGKLTRFDLVYNTDHLYWASPDDINGSIRVWDTMNHWPKSVKSMGEALTEHLGVDLTKLKPDFYSFKYAAMDAIISRSFACLQKVYYDRKGIKILTTPGATALKVYLDGAGKTKFCHHKIYGTHDEEQLSWLEGGLRGGRTEVFSLREYFGKIGYFDINSAYPYSMKMENVYPDPSKGFWATGHDEIFRWIESGFEGMVECDVEAINLHPFAMIYPYLGAKDEATTRFVFPLGKWKAKYTFYEIRQAIKLGYKFRFHKAMVYEKCKIHPFKKYVDFCYAIRMEGSEKKLPLLRDIGKSLGNNLYGKWGQKLIFTTLDDPNKYNPNDLLHCTRFGNSVLIEENKGYASHTNIIWGAYITSICRDLLYRHMMSAWDKGNDILYCDTDSIFITGGEWPDTDDLALGKLKHEGDLYYFRAYLPKQYEYQYLDSKSGGPKIDEKTGKVKTIYKAKGVPEWFEQTDSEGHPIYDANGNPVRINLREKFFTTGNVEFRKPLKLREALRRKNIKDKKIGRGIDAVNAWVTITKELQGSYTKRKVLDSYWTLPHWVGMKEPDWYKPPENFLKS